jgi:hypothetical protein
VPFRSRSQMRKFAMLLKQGKITKEKFDEWAHSTDMKSLPEKAGGGKSAKSTKHVGRPVRRSKEASKSSIRPKAKSGNKRTSR